MNWIRQEKRLAIYLRDGCACAWCGASIEDGSTILSLDHLVPHSRGGSNSERNLVTACKRCNDSRGARSIGKFAIAVANYIDHGVESATILAHVRETSKRPLDMAAAKQLIARRGSAANVMRHGGAGE